MTRYLLALLMIVGTAVAQESPHGAIKFACSACHGTTSWEMKSDASFKHEAVGFPLTGQHAILKCQACHQGPKFSSLKNRTCHACHTDVHKGEFAASCDHCHTTQAWLVNDMVQKHQDTRFPLLGRHAAAPCQSCHAGAAQHQYVGLPTTCIGCHRNDFLSATSPDHTSAGFSTDCMQCHTATASSWVASFDHSLTRFPLTGAHKSRTCETCHAGGNYQLVYSGCYPCHQADFRSAANPDHVSAAFSQNCQICHRTAAWQPATFDHSTTKFSLTGAHAAQACQGCHTNGNYQLVYTGCVQCHLLDYQGTTNPNHTTAGFPRTCETCHSTTAWTGAVFNHTWFPTNHGGAGGVCSQCHTNAADYSVFQCTNCHTRAQTDPRHSDVSGYVYNSLNCYQCHPRGSGGG